MFWCMIRKLRCVSIIDRTVRVYNNILTLLWDLISLSL